MYEITNTKALIRLLSSYSIKPVDSQRIIQEKCLN